MSGELIRLNKLLSRVGICSRRAADVLIAAGRVTVDGQVVTELGTKVDPDNQDVRCDGERLRPQQQVYLALNKPRGVVCTTGESGSRRRVVDLVDGVPGRLYTIGRLDADSTGLVLVTNDGDFAQKVAHPSHGVDKGYDVTVSGRVADEVRGKAAAGVWIGDDLTVQAQVSVRTRGEGRSRLHVILGEGRNREIRRLFAHLGHPVLSIRRVRIGPLEIGTLPEGSWRHLEPREVRALRGR